MSIRTVERSIRSALADNKVTQAEAEAIIETAEKGPVTTGEAQRIASLYEDGQWDFSAVGPPGALSQPRPPKHELEPGASTSLMNFFIAERVPQGEMYRPVKEDVEAAIRDIDRGALAMDEAPRTHNLHKVMLRDMRPVDGPMEEAFVDTQKDEIYLKVTGAGMAGPDTVGPYWYGPIALKVLDAVERVSSKLDPWTLANASQLDTTRTHTPRATDLEDLGDGEFALTLSAVNWQDPTDIRDSKRIVVDDRGSFLRELAADPTQSGGGLRPDVLQNMKDAFQRDRGSLNFTRDGIPMGMRFERVLLDKQPGFDTYSFYALIPAGAMAPGAPVSDLNDATKIFIERTGGFAGLTEYAGPVDLC